MSSKSTGQDDRVGIKGIYAENRKSEALDGRWPWRATCSNRGPEGVATMSFDEFVRPVTSILLTLK